MRTVIQLLFILILLGQIGVLAKDADVDVEFEDCPAGQKRFCCIRRHSRSIWDKFFIQCDGGKSSSLNSPKLPSNADFWNFVQPFQAPKTLKTARKAFIYSVARKKWIL